VLLKRLLVTGASGGVATQLRALLTQIAEKVRLSDIREITDLAEHEEFVAAELSDQAQVDAIVEGCDGVLHLGGISVEDTWEKILVSNIIGMHCLYTSAQKFGQPRIIFASSNHAMGAYKFTDMLDASALPRPDGYYGVSKAFGEQVASMYHDKFGQETLVVRIGSCLPKPKDPRMLSTWLSPEDFISLIDRTFTVQHLGYTIVYGASANTRRFWDDKLAANLGWEPKDDSEQFAAEFSDLTPYASAIEQGLLTYQGGVWLKAPLITK
jgi:uronate dehydrogenase